jgi:hypothetical protein
MSEPWKQDSLVSPWESDEVVNKPVVSSNSSKKTVNPAVSPAYKPNTPVGDNKLYYGGQTTPVTITANKEPVGKHFTDDEINQLVGNNPALSIYDKDSQEAQQEQRLGGISNALEQGLLRGKGTSLVNPLGAFIGSIGNAVQTGQQGADELSKTNLKDYAQLLTNLPVTGIQNLPDNVKQGLLQTIQAQTEIPFHLGMMIEPGGAAFLESGEIANATVPENIAKWQSPISAATNPQTGTGKALASFEDMALQLLLAHYIGKGVGVIKNKVNPLSAEPVELKELNKENENATGSGKIKENDREEYRRVSHGGDILTHEGEVREGGRGQTSSSGSTSRGGEVEGQKKEEEYKGIESRNWGTTEEGKVEHILEATPLDEVIEGKKNSLNRKYIFQDQYLALKKQLKDLFDQSSTEQTGNPLSKLAVRPLEENIPGGFEEVVPATQRFQEFNKEEFTQVKPKQINALNEQIEKVTEQNDKQIEPIGLSLPKPTENITENVSKPSAEIGQKVFKMDNTLSSFTNPTIIPRNSPQVDEAEVNKLFQKGKKDVDDLRALNLINKPKNKSKVIGWRKKLTEKPEVVSTPFKPGNKINTSNSLNSPHLEIDGQREIETLGVMHNLMINNKIEQEPFLNHKEATKVGNETKRYKKYVEELYNKNLQFLERSKGTLPLVQSQNEVKGKQKLFSDLTKIYEPSVHYNKRNLNWEVTNSTGEIVIKTKSETRAKRIYNKFKVEEAEFQRIKSKVVDQYNKLDISVKNKTVEYLPNLPNPEYIKINLRQSEKFRILRGYLTEFVLQKPYEDYATFIKRAIKERPELKENFKILSKEIDQAFKEGKKRDLLNYRGTDYKQKKNEKTLPNSIRIVEPTKKRIVSNEAYRQTLKDILIKSLNITLGIDPTVLKDHITILAYHVESGLRNIVIGKLKKWMALVKE